MEAYVNGEITVVGPMLEKEDKEFTLLAKGMSLCSNATVDNGLYGDPTEIALVDLANKYGMHKADL